MTPPVSSTAPNLRCPNCRYDRAGLPDGAVCPECGAPPPVAEGRDGVPDPAGSKATIAIGMAVLAWIGLVGFGILATPIGLGACWVAWGASRDLAGQSLPNPRVRLMAGMAAVLGLGAALAGLIMFIGLLLVL